MSETTITTTAPASTTTAPESSGASGSGQVTVNGAVFIPIVAVVAGLFVAGVIVVLRRRIYNLFRPLFGLPPLAEPSNLNQAENGRSGPPTVSAEQLAGTAPTSRGTGGGTAAATRGRRARRGVRRTDSGVSVRTLPVYSKEAGDEELVLVRRSSMGSLDEEGEEDDDGTREMRERRTSLSGVMDRVASIRRSGSIRSIASAISRRSLRAAPEATGATMEEAIPEDSTTTPQSAPPRSRQTSTTRRGWGEAPTYLEAMSSPLPLTEEQLAQQSQDENQLQRPPTLRERTSTTFRGLLTRTGLVPGPSSHSDPYNRHHPPSSHSHQPSSSVSLLLQPQTSRLSTLHSDPTTSAYPSPWTSTHSLGIISSPVPHSAVRASFETNDLPRAGLSEDQARFLGTKEATSLAGVRVGEVPAGKRRRASTSASAGGVPLPRNVSGGSRLSVMSANDGGSIEEGEGQLPTWDELDGERRRAEAEQGKGRADVLLAGGLEVGTITVEAEPGKAFGSDPSSSSPRALATTSAIAVAIPNPAATPPAPPPRLDISAPTPTSPTFASRLPIVSGPVLGM